MLNGAVVRFAFYNVGINLITSVIHLQLCRLNMLGALGHPFATCCEVLGVVYSNLAIFKVEPTTSDISRHLVVAKHTQHVAPNNVAIVWPGPVLVMKG